MLMYRRNRYLDELGIPRSLYCGNFVREKKFYRLFQRYRYGFDYRDIFNMDASFAEWLYSHMRMYKDNSVHDDTMNSIVFFRMVIRWIKVQEELLWVNVGVSYKQGFII